MHSLKIVEAFNPFDDIEPGLHPSFMSELVNALDFQSLEEAFNGRLSQQFACRLID